MAASGRSAAQPVADVNVVLGRVRFELRFDSFTVLTALGGRWGVRGRSGSSVIVVACRGRGFVLHGVAWEVDAVERVVGLGMYISREARRLQRSVAVLEQGFIALCTWKIFSLHAGVHSSTTFCYHYTLNCVTSDGVDISHRAGVL